MPITEEIKITAPDQGEFKLLPNDVYQVILKDVEVRTMKKYKSEEEAPQLMYKFQVCDAGEYNGAPLVGFSTFKWFDGGKGSNPSKLFQIFQAFYSYYEPKANLSEFEAEMINMDMINGLIGKQIRVTTAQTPNKKNKLTAFMAIKEELPEPKELKPKNETKKDLDPGDFEG